MWRRAEKETWLTLNEILPQPGGRGLTNVVQKCKFCGREATVTVITGRGHPLTQALSEKGSYTFLMLFDCRGFEPVGYDFGTGWEAESIAGTKFEDIDLSNGEYAEYYEKGECPVMISNLRAYFSVVK